MSLTETPPISSIARTRDVEYSRNGSGMCAVFSRANCPRHRSIVRRSIERSSSRFRVRSSSRARATGP